MTADVEPYLVLTLDVADLELQTAFWCAALGYEHRDSVGQYRALVDPAGKGPKMLLQRVDEPKSAKFIPVPEAKAGKNRLHLDLHVVDVAAAADRLTALGAQRVRRVDQFGIFWITMLDPEGNEFCVVPV